MDIRVVKTENGKRYNSIGQELIACRLCGGNTTMLGIKLCDGCWELETRIESNPGLARKILQEIEENNNGN